jgi:hypothetical protein
MEFVEEMKKERRKKDPASGVSGRESWRYFTSIRQPAAV